MPLSKDMLAQDIERALDAKPGSSAEAAAKWANAYATYAGAALSSASSLPTTAQANQGMLVGAFQGGLAAMTSVSAASIIALGIVGYWQAMIWAGPTAAGMTVFPGNASLSGALAAIFSDLSQKSTKDKADQLASAFDLGAKSVVVSDIPLIQPAPPIVGPIQ